MRENCTSGSVAGAPGNGRSYAGYDMIDMDSPEKIKEKIITIFPEFKNEFEEDEEITFHCIFLTLSPISNVLFSSATQKQIKEFCSILNSGIQNGGEFEDAISTCFLEHASQINIRNIIKPHLSKEAKNELR